MTRTWNSEVRFADATIRMNEKSKIRLHLFRALDNIFTFLCFFLFLTVLVGFSATLSRFFSNQFPTSQSLMSDSRVLVAALFGSLIILKTRLVVLRHMRFAKYYSLTQTAIAGMFVLVALLVVFALSTAIASNAGRPLPQSLVNGIAQAILTLLVLSISLIYYTVFRLRPDPRILASVCFGMASREQSLSSKLWWVSRGANQMSKYFYRLGFPIKESSLNRILLGKLLQKRNGNRILRFLSQALSSETAPEAILTRIDSDNGANILDLDSHSRTVKAIQAANSYAPSLSIFVAIILFVLTYLMR